MLELKQYEELAHKILYNYCKKKSALLSSDELIGTMIEYMAVADWKYNASHGLTPHQFRQMRGIYAIRTFLKQQKKYTKLLYNSETIKDRPITKYTYNEKASSKIRFLIKNSNLTKKQLEMMKLYLEGFSISMAGEKLGLNSDQSYKLYKSCIKKLSGLTNRKDENEISLDCN